MRRLALVSLFMALTGGLIPGGSAEPALEKRKETRGLKKLHSVEQIVRRIIELSGVVAVIVLLAMMMMTVTDVTLRFFFNRPIIGSAEITTYMMVGAGFLGLAWCALAGGHINVDLIADKLSPRGLAVTDSINYLIVIGMSVLIGKQSYSQSMFVQRFNVKSTITGIPTYPFYLIVTFGFLLLSLAAVILLVHTVKGMKK